MGLEVSTEFLEGGLHSRPGELRRRLQEAIDRASAGGGCDRIAIGYGVCGRGAVGLRARSVPLVIPKVHDCIALFLGSDAAYKREFVRFPGTYYVSAGWYNEKVQPLRRVIRDDAARKAQSADPGDPRFRELSEKYGADNARAIVEFLGSWKRNYRRAAFINTGVGHKRRYAEHARAMAAQFDWQYQELPGSRALIGKMLKATRSDAEILFVPPGHLTVFDAAQGALKAAPAREASAKRCAGAVSKATTTRARAPREGRARFGLGIDAGGTYTDVALFDFQGGAKKRDGRPGGALRAKAKALTTKWDYTVGIEQALDALDASLFPEVDLVAVSTTLATNAIVEGHGQRVGLLIMAPEGLFNIDEFPHHPTAFLSARMNIDGKELAPVDPAEVRRIAQGMIDRDGVGAFAVSGYGGCVNPAHELEVKRVVRDATGRSVTCGHELSARLNFRTRADTAVLNARIIPRLEKFLREAEQALRRRGVRAPIMVVKGDGSLINAATARERPVETILSGPAASVAGARRLTHEPDALVIDMGGTTTDTASIRRGAAAINLDGARVREWITHVQALDMRTVGLGGDSRIAWVRRELRVGPQRVAPIAWLADRDPAGTAQALDHVEANLEEFAADSHPLELLALTNGAPAFDLGPHEARLVETLRERPFSLDELARATGAASWRLLDLARLEEHCVVQRCALTPTDLLHVEGKFRRWDAAAARRMAALMASLIGVPFRELSRRVHEWIVRGLIVELLKKQLDDTNGRAPAPDAPPDAMDHCAVCETLVDKIAERDPGEMAIRVRLKRPVIGLGAPVACYLPEAARRMGARVLIPPDADVANAIGAITSVVTIAREARVVPDGLGGFDVHGLPRPREFRSIDAATRFAQRELRRTVLQAARAAGTRETAVELDADDRIAVSSEGVEVFLERVLTATLSGPPDARLKRAQSRA